VVLIGVVTVGIYAWDKFAPISKQTEYAGLRLGTTTDEIKYIEGIPQTVIDSRVKGWPEIAASAELKRGKEIEDYNEWWYEVVTHNIDLEFDKDKLIVIKCSSRAKHANCPALGGIYDGDSEKTLFYRFGEPSTTSLHGTVKTVEYSNVGVLFYLEREAVYALGIHDTDYKNSCDADKCLWTR
jgi:hypothetical protein